MMVYLKIIILLACLNKFVIVSSFETIQDAGQSNLYQDQADKNIEQFLKYGQNRDEDEDIDTDTEVKKPLNQRDSKQAHEGYQSQYHQNEKAKEPMSESQKIAILRKLLFEEAKKIDNLNDIKISDQDLYKKIDKHIEASKDDLLKKIQETFKQKFKNQEFSTPLQQRIALVSSIKIVAFSELHVLIYALLYYGSQAVQFISTKILEAKDGMYTFFYGNQTNQL